MRKGSKDKTQKEVLAEVKAFKEEARPVEVTEAHAYAYLQGFKSWYGYYALGKMLYNKEEGFDDIYNIKRWHKAMFYVLFACFCIFYYYDHDTVGIIFLLTSCYVLLFAEPAVYRLYGYFALKFLQKPAAAENAK